MRQRWIVAVVALGLYVCPLRAGLYNTSDPEVGPTVTQDGVEAVPFQKFHQDLTDFLILRDPSKPSKLRDKYKARLDELQPKERSGRLTVPEQVDLGACLIRLGQAEKALPILRDAAGKDRRNPLVMANLATAHQLLEDWTPAIDCLHQALSFWPPSGPNWSKEQRDWYKRVEEHQLKLVRLRAREAKAQPAGKRKLPEQVDALFGLADAPVRFVGESGQFEAGKLAATERAKLPKDAIPLVQQLLVWFPHDERLYWLYGELLNAEGDLVAAKKVFDDLIYSRNYNVTALQEHRQFINAATAPVRWMPEWSQLYLVGGIAGLVVLLLAYFQVREMVRRRRGGTAGKG